MKQLKSKTKLVARFLFVAILGLSVLAGCKSYDKDIDALNADIDALQTELNKAKEQAQTNLDAAVASINTQITSLTTKINTLEANSATKAELQAAKTELNTKIDGVTAQITAINAEITAAKNKIAALEANSATKAELAAAKTELLGLLASKADLQAARDEIAADISNLQVLLEGKIGELKTELLDLLVSKTALEEYKVIVTGLYTSLDGRVATLEAKETVTPAQLEAVKQELLTQIGTVNSGLTALTGRVTTLEGSVGGLQTTVGTLSTQMTQVTNFLGGLLAQSANLEALLNLKADKSALATLQTQVNGIDTEVATLKGKIATAEGNITTIQGQITTILNQFNDYYTKVEVDAKLNNYYNKTEVETKLGALKTELQAEITSKINTAIATLQTELGLRFAYLNNRLTSLVFSPTLYINSIPAMDFSPIDPISCPPGSSGSAVPKLTVRYHVNPSHITLADIDAANAQFYVKNVKNQLYQAPAVENRIKPNITGISNGIMTVEVTVSDFNVLNNTTLSATGFIHELFNAVALQVPLAEKNVTEDVDAYVTSDYVRLYSESSDAVTTLALAAKKVGDANYTALNTTFACPTAPAHIYEVNEGETIDLTQTVFNSWLPVGPAGNLFTTDQLNDYGFYIEYSKVNCTINGVEQSTFVTSNAADVKAGKITVATLTQAQACAGATPVIKAVLKSTQTGNCEYAVGYVQLKVKHKINDYELISTTTGGGLISEYWTPNAAAASNPNLYSKLIKHNVFVPVVGELDNTKAVFEGELGNAFITNPDLTLKGALAGYKFVFTTSQPTHAHNGVNYVFTPQNGGKELWYDFGGANATKIAEIKSDASRPHYIELNKASNLAKELLNVDKEFLTARLGLQAPYCPVGSAIDEQIAITLGGKKQFDVVFVRPISATAATTDYFIDGVSFPNTGSYITIKDLVNPYDWRNYYLNDHAYLYSYYNVYNIAVNTANITTNMNQSNPATFVPLSTFPGLIVTNDVVGADDVVRYDNNYTVLGDEFFLRIPITIDYEWGSVQNAIVTVRVDATVGQQP